jgi:hypothetical protein
MKILGGIRDVVNISSTRSIDHCAYGGPVTSGRPPLRVRKAARLKTSRNSSLDFECYKILKID